MMRLKRFEFKRFENYGQFLQQLEVTGLAVHRYMYPIFNVRQSYCACS